MNLPLGISMLNPDFNEPLSIEPDGTFITMGQLQLFINSSKGRKQFKEGDPKFFDYYNLCRVYNLVSKIMETDWDSAVMYWDDKKEIVSMAFPTGGAVALALSNLAPHSFNYGEERDDEDDNNNWGLFDNTSNY